MIPDLLHHRGTLLLPLKKAILFTFAFYFTTSCFSQDDLRIGYMVNNNGDTLFGYVQYRYGYRAYRDCSFSENGREIMAVFEPKDIKGYGFINGRVFESTKLNTEGEIKELVFLEVKIRGLVSLYKFEENLFVQRNTDSLQQLSNDKAQQLMNGKRIMRYSNQYVAVLNTVLFDCLELRERTQKVQFFESQIATLIEDYNKCRGNKAVIYNATKP